MQGENTKKIDILGVPLGFGAGKPGSELGVEAIRRSTIRGNTLVHHLEQLCFHVNDRGNVQLVQPPDSKSASGPVKHLAEVSLSSENIAAGLIESLASGATPIVLGGDHSIAIGSFSGISTHFKQKNQDIGLIWFDAHADINTPETSGSGNVHGMPLAALLGHGADELVHVASPGAKLDGRFLAHIGARDVDPGERETIEKLGLRDHFFTMSDIDKRGMLACVEDAIRIAGAASGGFAVTFDVDMIDPRFAPGSGTLVRGGTTYREAHLALELIAESGLMRSFEIVEVNPLLDQSNLTVELACELILSAFGKTIL
ncbi:MAG: arginase [Acidobacteria bacterium]|nr:arginase [Acidobacteriota bacterium]